MTTLEQVLVAIMAAIALGVASASAVRLHQLRHVEEFKPAVIACLNNNAYIGINQEDTRALFLQCLDDYKQSNLRSNSEGDNR